MCMVYEIQVRLFKGKDLQIRCRTLLDKQICELEDCNYIERRLFPKQITSILALGEDRPSSKC